MDQLSVVAGITAFHPDGRFHERLRSIAAQVSKVLIVDNSSDGPVDASLLPRNVEVYFNENRGAMAGALNVALRRARAMGCDFFLTLDQDSDIPVDFVSSLVRTARLTGASIVGPNFRNATTGAPGRFYVLNEPGMPFKWFPRPSGVHEALFVITSGMLIDLSSPASRVEYREEFLVDFVDVDFCLAARRFGAKVVVDTDVSMSHAMGNKKSGSWRFSTSRYSASRRYLTSRNRAIVWSESWRSFPAFVGTDVLISLADVLRTIAYEPHRWQMLRAFTSGAADGWRSVLRAKRR